MVISAASTTPDYRALPTPRPATDGERGVRLIYYAFDLLHLVFVPEDQQGDVLALQLAMNGGPIRLRDPAMAAFAAPAGVERRLQRLVVHALWKGPGEACGLHPLQRLPHSRAGDAKPAGDLVCRYAGKLQPNNLARIAHPNPLRWHRSSFGVAKGAT
jgi:hypothetical protein